MTSATWSLASQADSGPLLARLRAKLAPLAMIAAGHLVLFYFVYSGMLQRVAHAALPQAVLVTFIAPVAPPPPPPSVSPKTVALVAPPLPQVTIVPIIPQERLLTTPPPQPAPAVQERAPVVLANANPSGAGNGPKLITSGVEYLQPLQPVYPSLSKRMGEQGKVLLRVLVNEKGQAEQVLVQSSSGSVRLDEAGRQAALRALFKPYVEEGRPVAVYVLVPVNFQLAS